MGEFPARPQAEDGVIVAVTGWDTAIAQVARGPLMVRSLRGAPFAVGDHVRVTGTVADPVSLLPVRYGSRRVRRLLAGRTVPYRGAAW